MCQNNIDNMQYNSEFKIKFSLVFRCSECIVECMNNELHHTHNLFDLDWESENEVNDVKNKSNPNDDDSIVVPFNEIGEKVDDTMYDDTDNKISDNNEDEKEDNIIKIILYYSKMSVLNVVYEAHFFKTNINVFKDLLKYKK